MFGACGCGLIVLYEKVLRKSRGCLVLERSPESLLRLSKETDPRTPYKSILFLWSLESRHCCTFAHCCQVPILGRYVWWGAGKPSPGDVPTAQRYSPQTRAGVGELGAGKQGPARLLVGNVSCVFPPLMPSSRLPCLSLCTLSTMRSALLLAAILALSLALGVVCKESQEKVVPSKGHMAVRRPSSWACLGRVLGNVMGATALLGKVWWWRCGWWVGNYRVSVSGLGFPASLLNSCAHCLGHVCKDLCPSAQV